VCEWRTRRVFPISPNLSAARTQARQAGAPKPHHHKTTEPKILKPIETPDH